VSEISSPVQIGVVQINSAFSGQSYLPYVAGMLQASTERFASRPERFQFLLPLYKRQHVDSSVAHLAPAHIAAFSTYVWNFRVSLAIAERLKAVDPDKLIVFGGPHVPDRIDDFLDRYPFVDVIVHSEGERVFVDLIEAFPHNDWSEIPGISYRDEAGRRVTNPKAPRFANLEEIPSPYLKGTFDALMQAHPDEQWIVLWETNRGCPFQCTFCDWGSMTQSKVLRFEMERLQAEIAWISAHEINYVYCCDANFGILPRDIELVESVARHKAETGFPRVMGVQNTKNATDRAYTAQKILTEAGLTNGVDLALQSVDSHTLEIIKRKNISLDSYEDLQQRFTRDGIATFSDIILGLPGETYDSFASGVSHVIANGQHNRIQFNTLSILPNAELGDPDYQARHGVVTVETRTLNTHGMVTEFDDGVFETQQMVVATAAMPADDWRRARVFAWLTAFLHFDKILQVPLIMAHRSTGLSFRELIEAFCEVDGQSYPLLGEIRDHFAAQAMTMQQGGPEYEFSAEWLGIYWPQDEHMLIQLSVENRLDPFYEEAGRLLLSLGAERMSARLMTDAVRFNRALLKQPFLEKDCELQLDHDLLPYYRAVLHNEEPQLVENPTRYRIERSPRVWTSWADWMREVVWYGNKSGAYLYDSVIPCDATSCDDRAASGEGAPLMPSFESALS
jgi:tRNA A37 methylthiotransferase MiaB